MYGCQLLSELFRADVFLLQTLSNTDIIVRSITESLRCEVQLKPSLSRTVLAGIGGGFAMNLAMLFTFRLIGFGWSGKGIILNPDVQSRKLIAVWTEIEPLPLVVNNPAPIIVGIILFGIIHAFAYRWISPAWPKGIVTRGMRMAILIFLLVFSFWEFFTPFNQFGEPLPLIGLELLFWSIIALADGFVIAFIIEKRTFPQ